MDVKVLKRLVTCLEMMNSEHDGEALAAARMAAKIAKEHKLSWADVIKVTITTEEPVKKAPGSWTPYAGPSPFSGQEQAGLDQLRRMWEAQAASQAQYYNQNPYQAGMGGAAGMGGFGGAGAKTATQVSEDQRKSRYEKFRDSLLRNP